jgi:uncharacterized protein YcbX
MRITVSELWRYPISAVGGERLDAIDVNEGGVLGDRRWAIVDSDGNPAWPDKEKRWRSSLEIRARLQQPEPEIKLDATGWMSARAPAALDALRSHFGFPVSVIPQRPHGSDRVPGESAERYSRAPIHLLSATAISGLRARLPGSAIDSRRFRPNVVISGFEHGETPPESAWIGRRVRIGEVVVEITEPCTRCVLTVLPQGNLPFDRAILGTIASDGGGFGVYGRVVTPGVIGIGTDVELQIDRPPSILPLAHNASAPRSI